MAKAVLHVIDMYDATTGSFNWLPVGKQGAGYTTGRGIAWTPAQFRSKALPFPAVRIDQDSNAADPTADILDVENGAATVSEVPRWVNLARASFDRATRPGQRWPGIYCNLSTLNGAIAALESAGLTNVPFAIADLTNRADAVRKVSMATGPYPRVWQQYQFGSVYDSGIVSVDWLTKVSGGPAPLNPTLVYQDTGAAVLLLQTRLNDWGFNLVVDGDFGLNTLNAVDEFQLDHGLTEDGIVGPITWVSLNDTP